MHIGVCYYPEHWPESIWREDAARMKTLGVERVRIAEFAWSRIEPVPGEYDWGWLDRAVDVLGEAGLQVVMCTPTATPPKWLVDQHPDILAIGADGRTRAFGSRRHYDFSSPSYHKAAAKICLAIAKRYGNHPAVAFWQTDNEYGCHHTVVNYSPAAIEGFRRWLKLRYGDIQTLNRAWGTVFWSMEYRNFDEIDPPIGTVTEAHPSHRLDYRRFASDEVARFNRMQVDIIRQVSPGRPIAHNFMQLFTEFDHYRVADDLDIAAWDSYPLGALEEQWFDPEVKAKWLRTGHPDLAAFNHDVYRGMSKLPFWVMEQQPGPVNWANWNPAPLPGMVRLWSWEAFAHGAGCVSYFRWRQAPFAQEQMHAGLNTPDNLLDVGGNEARQVAEEIRLLKQHVGTAVVTPMSQQSRAHRVALIWDYESKWLFEIHPQGQDFHYPRFAFEYYSALRSLGLDVDIVPANAKLDGYRMIVVPPLPIVPDDLAVQLTRLAATQVEVVIGPRTGSKTVNLTIPAALPPGNLTSILPIRVWRVESLRPNVTEPVDGGSARHWRDFVEAGADVDVDARFSDGLPAVLRYGHVRYFASLFDPSLTQSLFQQAATTAGLTTMHLPEGVRVSELAGLTYIVNYGHVPYDIVPAAGEIHDFVIGERHVAPQQVAVFRRTPA
ncbi:beta-galactosidase [Robbsia andropogonis]|uniref:Beta-galactosidase n=1 Tax=Robbsia andropogonis TaxID=28092 RepID=A0A0F5K060_9BURK|nr:beta-galactosidase [Robbsia andropogonis]KKB63315.1 beta-galactosidase [Robbsia andropogonis]